MSPALVVHLGVGRRAARLASRLGPVLERATLLGWSVLRGGGPALDAVVTAVAALEDDPLVGSPFAEAAVVGSGSRAVGVVSDTGAVPNPVCLARAALDAGLPPQTGDAAEALAERLGLPCGATTRRGADEAGGLGAAGAVALDFGGRLAAAASGPLGLAGEEAGLVGADARRGAVAASAAGRGSLPPGFAEAALERLRDHTAQEAAWLSIRALERRRGGSGGVVLVGVDGSMGYAFDTPAMGVAYVDLELGTPEVSGLG